MPEFRDPAIHRFLVGEVIFAEPRFQSGFFDENDIQVEQCERRCCKKQNRERSLIETESCKQYQTAYVHWIANEFVWAFRDELTGRIENRRRASPSRNKDRSTRQYDQPAHCASNQANDSSPCRQWNLQTFVPRLNARCEPTEKQNERGHVAQRPARN